MRRARHALLALALGAVACERMPPGPSPGAASGIDGTSAPAAASSGPLSRFAGHHVAVVFGFTACPDVCPTTLWHWRRAIETLSVEQSARLRLAFVTVDPERDTAERLERYTAHFDPAFVGVRAEGDELKALLRSLHAHARKVPSRTPGEYTMDHTATAFLLGPDGTLRDEIRHGTAPAEIARRLRTALASEGTPRSGTPKAARSGR